MRKAPEMLSVKRVRFIILAGKGMSIIARVRWLKQTRYVYILRSNVEITKNAFHKARAVRVYAVHFSCSIGNIDLI